MDSASTLTTVGYSRNDF